MPGANRLSRKEKRGPPLQQHPSALLPEEDGDIVAAGPTPHWQGAGGSIDEVVEVAMKAKGKEEEKNMGTAIKGCFIFENT